MLINRKYILKASISSILPLLWTSLPEFRIYFFEKVLLTSWSKSHPVLVALKGPDRDSKGIPSHWWPRNLSPTVDWLWGQMGCVSANPVREKNAVFHPLSYFHWCFICSSGCSVCFDVICFKKLSKSKQGAGKVNNSFQIVQLCHLPCFVMLLHWWVDKEHLPLTSTQNESLHLHIGSYWVVPLPTNGHHQSLDF